MIWKSKWDCDYKRFCIVLCLVYVSHCCHNNKSHCCHHSDSSYSPFCFLNCKIEICLYHPLECHKAKFLHTHVNMVCFQGGIPRNPVIAFMHVQIWKPLWFVVSEKQFRCYLIFLRFKRQLVICSQFYQALGMIHVLSHPWPRCLPTCSPALPSSVSLLAHCSYFQNYPLPVFLLFLFSPCSFQM